MIAEGFSRGFSIKIKIELDFIRDNDLSLCITDCHVDLTMIIDDICGVNSG